MRYPRWTSVLLLLTLGPQSLPGQQPGFQTYLESKAGALRNATAVLAFYEATGYRPAWINPAAVSNRQVMAGLVARAAEEGLDPDAYQLAEGRPVVAEIPALPSAQDSFDLELQYTDAALSYFSHLAYGNTVPSLSYQGLSYKPASIQLPLLLAEYLAFNKLGRLPDSIQPPMPEVKMIRAALGQLRWAIALPGFREDKIIASGPTASNKPLARKLYYLGIIDSLEKSRTAKEMTVALKQAQRMFGLLDDGVLRSTLLRELNTPLRTRVNQLSLSLNYYRWLYGLTRKEPIVVVNIPAAYLKVYQDGIPIIQMRMIVGKASTPTPTLSSRIHEVILYPYWSVPYSIATKELLPSIRRNPGYLAAQNYQVLDSRGKIVDPYAVDWNALGPGNFPYTIRQGTGCDNALGLLKLNFYNPFSVYLHDTPSKSLFMLQKRFFSHGCMRMEDPAEVGHFVLKENGIAIDTLTEKGCLRNQAPIVVPVRDPVPVLVWYNPAGLDSTGRLVIFDDIYRRLGRLGND